MERGTAKERKKEKTENATERKKEMLQDKANR